MCCNQKKIGGNLEVRLQHAEYVDKHQVVFLLGVLKTKPMVCVFSSLLKKKRFKKKKNIYIHISTVDVLNLLMNPSTDMALKKY